MQLVEQHIIDINNPSFKEIDSLCLKSKNLYNASLYNIRQEYINNKNNILPNLYHIMKTSEQYLELPTKVACSVLLMVQKNFKAFFKAKAEYIKNPSKFKGIPNIPHYLDTTNGRFITSYTNQAISKKVFIKTNKIKLSQSNIEFKTRISDFNQIDCIRLVPKIGYYVIEVVYTVPDTTKLTNNARYIAIDLGVNNLATITSNIREVKPIIINGKPLKSINQYYNKKLSEYTSILEKRNKVKTSKKTQKLTLKRKNKVDNYLHKASKEIIKHCINNEINTVIIGKNINWKQDVNIGNRSNQNFVNIPHSRFISMITYKCEIAGINIILQEESYTSKASFLNLDKIPTYKKGNMGNHGFSGYRYRRGLYKLRGKKVFINADVNGSYNILRKAVPNAFVDGIEGIGVCPTVLTVK